MRVLITSAFIDPNVVGEPRWCYDLAKGISERIETIIISQTPVHGRTTIAELFPHATVYENRGWDLAFLDKRIRALVKPNYLKFYRFAEQIIRTKIAPGTISCAHQFGPLGMRYPTPLRKTGIPYIVGPVGGSLPLPAGFDRGSTQDPWYYKLREFDRLRFRFDPALRASYQNAEYLVGAGNYVEGVLSDMSLKRFVMHSQRIAPPVNADVAGLIEARARRTGPLRLLAVSRLIYSKGLHYLLQALGAIQDTLPEWRLDILGEGVYRGELERLSQSLGLSDRVHFHGHRPRGEVDGFYRDADMFLFPTIREPSGTVTFECMSWGLPIIAADYGGPATHVKDDYGVRVPVASPQGFVDGLAAAIMRLGGSAELRASMGRNAVKAAQDDHSIEEMVDFFVDLYRRIARPLAA